MYIIVYPEFFSVFIIEYTASLPSESIIVVGSSNTIYLGFTAKTPAIAILCFCPSDNSSMSPIFSFSILTFSKAWFILIALSSKFRFLSANASSSSILLNNI